MKNIFFRIFLLSNLLTLFFFPVHSQENKILVRVENEIITSFQLKNKIRTSLILSNQEVNQEVNEESSESSGITEDSNITDMSIDTDHSSIDLEEEIFGIDIDNI